jgi:hypothetical protein
LQTHFVFRTTLVAAIVVLLAASMSSARSGQRQSTSAETKARMLQLIATLETDPYNKDAKAYRREVLVWLTDAPDVTVELCADLLGDVKKLKGDDGAALVGQLAFSEAKYILEHPEKAKDRHAVSVAGIDGVLRTYVAMKTAKPNVKIEPMDRLIQIQADGKLDAYTDQALANCK